MRKFSSSACANPNMLKLTGTIRGLKTTRIKADFTTLSSVDATKALTSASALLGLSSHAQPKGAPNGEDADFVEFYLDDMPLKGWAWRSPFQEGDVVQAAVRKRRDYYEVYGIARPADRCIALYPHCSSGSAAFKKSLFSSWLRFSVIASCLLSTGLTCALTGCKFDSASIQLALMMWCALSITTTLFLFKIAERFKPASELAENIFTALGLENAAHINLRKNSRTHRTAEHSFEFGTFYYRY